MEFKLVIVLFVVINYSNSFESSIKCCDHGLILNESMVCEPPSNGSYPFDASEAIINANTTCSVSSELEVTNSSSGLQKFLNLTCIDISSNGTLFFQNCSFIHKPKQRHDQCQSLFTPITFWGVSIVVFASLLYIIPYFTVVFLYCIMPDLRRKCFDKGVMVFCSTQVSIALILCILGFFVLCNTIIPKIAFVLSGLTLMFLTVSSVFWMSIMCFDVTLTITRFRWVPSSNADDENRKFRTYVYWVYSAAFIPTMLVGILDLVSFVPEDWIIKPNFHKFYDINIPVIAYVMTIPFLCCLTNTVLFCYTSWKMFEIKKSTSMAKENQKEKAQKNYIMYLKLYFLMDAPWVTSGLGALYPDLWILKLFRMIHPILLLLTILPRKMVVRTVKCNMQPNIENQTKSSKKENVPKQEIASENV